MSRTLAGFICLIQTGGASRNERDWRRESWLLLFGTSR